MAYESRRPHDHANDSAWDEAERDVEVQREPILAPTPGKRSATGPAISGRVSRLAAGAGTPGKFSRTMMGSLMARSPGERLPEPLRAELERRLRADLSGVR